MHRSVAREEAICEEVAAATDYEWARADGDRDLTRRMGDRAVRYLARDSALRWQLLRETRARRVAA